MSDYQFTIRRPYDVFGEELELRYAFRYHSAGNVNAVTGTILTTVAENEALPYEPMLRVPKFVGQQMLDELWNLGFRPRSDVVQAAVDLKWFQDNLAKFIAKATA